MKKISKIFFLLIVSMFFLTGCNEEVNLDSGSTVDKDTDTTNATGTLLCSRNGKGLEDSTAELSYEINYKRGYITKLHSIEKLISDDQKVLDQYEEAYKNIMKDYKNLKYYDNTITREDNVVICDTTINYSKVDMAKLAEIESKGETIIKNGKLSLKDWIELASKVGARCIEK